MVNKVEEDSFKPWVAWTVAIVICILVWLGGAATTRWYAVHCSESHDDATEAMGLFGDSFGAVNALISALAFAGVLVTFRLQRKELDLQRQELQAQRAEFAQQNTTLKLQRFENTFFHMMELQQQIVNDLRIQNKSKEHLRTGTGIGQRREEIVLEELKGRQVIRHIYKYVHYQLELNGFEGYRHAGYGNLLDHYFRHLYTILRYIDETDAFDNNSGETDVENARKQKYHYTTIVRATLSRYELLLLYYNGLSFFGREKMKPLIEKYALLNNIDAESLAFSKEYQNALDFDSRNEDRGWGARYGISGTDFEYYLTEEDNNPSKYNIRAFGLREEDIAMHKQVLRNFEQMLRERQ